MNKIIDKTTLAESPIKKTLKKKLDLIKPFSKDLKVRQIYTTDKKESIYKHLDTNNSKIASGGPSNVLVVSRAYRNN